MLRAGSELHLLVWLVFIWLLAKRPNDSERHDDPVWADEGAGFYVKQDHRLSSASFEFHGRRGSVSLARLCSGRKELGRALVDSDHCIGPRRASSLEKSHARLAADESDEPAQIVIRLATMRILLAYLLDGRRLQPLDEYGRLVQSAPIGSSRTETTGSIGSSRVLAAPQPADLSLLEPS